MKKIVIYQKNDNFPLEFIDEDENSIEDFCKDLEVSFSSQTVTTLHFKSSSVLLRPNLVSKIYVENIIPIDTLIQKQSIATEKLKAKPKEKVEITEDVITEE
jgi:hypothetical protein